VRRVGIIGVAQTPYTLGDQAVTAPELVYDVARRAVAESGLRRGAIDATFSGSSDMLDGRSFGFVFGLESLGAWPPIHESHVEQDGAWAAWYAWLKIQSGEADSALVASWGRVSEGSPHHVFNSQLDPFSLAPLGLDHVTSAALQADAWMARTGARVDDLDAAAASARRNGAQNPLLEGVLAAVEQDGAAVATPLLDRHCAPLADGACALVLAAEEVARSVCEAPAWIVAADQRAESGSLGHRDLSRLPSVRKATARARRLAGWETGVQPDVAELSASFAHQVGLIAEEAGLGAEVAIDPSGGALAADPVMTTGLARLVEAALQVRGLAGGRQVDGATRALAHAGAGHALQQNLVWLLEADR
jgi:acetyl-CoA acetyltransferase